MSSDQSAHERPLRRGDVVEIRSAADILATLDGDGALENMPFMPEMAAYIGRRYRVSRRVDKICNTIDLTGSRRMHNTVYLEDLRCNGSGHGGCQAGCLFYWKQAWLQQVGDDNRVVGVDKDKSNEDKLEHLARVGTRTVRGDGGNQAEAWRCQATEALKASQPLKVSNLRQYWREATNGNFETVRFVGLLVRALVMEVARRLGFLKPLPLKGPESGPVLPEPLNLQPGELVRVRSPSEIAVTLNRDGTGRGLSFDREMLPFCGHTFRVRDRVRRIIDEKTGCMLTIPRDCLILEGVVCSGERSVGRWFCPRAIYPFWRESWLARVDKRAEPKADDQPAN
jgi:hypothetical protein